MQNITRRTLLKLLPGFAIGLAACQTAPSPSPPAAQAASGSGQAAAPPEWQQTLDAARAEGTVAVFGPDGEAMKNTLVTGFEKQFGIPVTFLGGLPLPGPTLVINERNAGQYNWDIYVGGTTTSLTALLPVGALDPMDPALILPDVKDPHTWRGGGLEFLDDGHRVLVMTPFQRGTIFYTPSFADLSRFTSYKDLLDSKWKGKMLLDDPRQSGPGQATFTFFYLHPDLGEDFIRALAQQNFTLMHDFEQEVDSVAHGSFQILLGTADYTAEARRQQGIPIEILDTRQLKEGSDVSPANGSVSLFNRQPHPNAAKVYMNWLLGKDEQTDFAKVNSYVSSRLDVPTDFLPAWRVPQPGAIRTYDEQAMALKAKIVGLCQEVFGAA